MNGAHLHLLINHIPVFAAAFGLIALVWTMIRPSKDMLWASVGLFLLAGVSSWIVAETGDAAEAIVKNLAEVTRASIHEHEAAADFANISATIVAVAALLMGAAAQFKPKLFKTAQIIVLILALWMNSVMARTAYLGGQIRHSEIRAETAPQTPKGP